MDDVARNRLRIRMRRPQGGDNDGFAIMEEGDVGEQTARNAVFPPLMSERGGGDGMDNRNRLAWHPRNPVDNIRLRLMRISMNFAILVVIPLMILSIFVLMNSSLESEIFDIIKKGHISSQYIRITNEALALADQKKMHTFSGKLKKLSQTYSHLMENIQELMAELNGMDEDGEPSF